jgi:Ni,Fe-hydrogenase III component G
MNENAFAVLHTEEPISRGQIPPMSFAEFRRAILDAVADGQRVAALFGDSPPSGDKLDLYAILADSAQGVLRAGKTTLESDRFASLTPDCPQMHLFEREIAEQYGVCPEGHPWLKPVRFHASYRSRPPVRSEEGGVRSEKGKHTPHSSLLTPHPSSA